MAIVKETLGSIIPQIDAADVSALCDFLKSNPSQPLLATGSGGCESAGDYLSLLYGALGGVACCVTPYTLNSFSNEALRTSKLVLLSRGGHNNDIVFATRRALDVHPAGTACVNFSGSDRNEALKLFRKRGAGNAFVFPVHDTHEGFVSTGTSLAYFALLAKVFQPDLDLGRYLDVPENPFRMTLNDGSLLSPEDLRTVRSYVILHGGWGRPVAWNLEGKLVECGLACAGVYDYRNYCHGRFIWTSNHMDDSAVVLLVSPREREIAERTRKYLPASAKIIVIETEHDSPEASLDLLVRATEFFRVACEACGANPASPRNPGRIDKRVPMWVPFMATLSKQGPLTLEERP